MESQQDKNLVPDLDQSAKIAEEENEAVKKCREEFTEIKKQADEYLNGWKRAKADLMNYQKDETKRFEEVIKFGYAGILKEFITVLDSFDIAIKGMKEKPDAGFVMIRNQLLEIMKKFGVEKMECKLGVLYDAATTEVIEEVEGKEPPGTVIEEVGSGYRLHGRVLRPSRIKVARLKENDEDRVSK